MAQRLFDGALIAPVLRMIPPSDVLGEGGGRRGNSEPEEAGSRPPCAGDLAGFASQRRSSDGGPPAQRQEPRCRRASACRSEWRFPQFEDSTRPHPLALSSL